MRKKRKFRFTRWFMLVLELKVFTVEPVIIKTFLDAHNAISKYLNH